MDDTQKQIRNKDMWAAPLCEGALILLVGLAAWLAQQPWIFASLGPTAYELIETPKRPSARPYNILIGHAIGIGSGFAMLFATHAWLTPPVSPGHIAGARIAAAALSATLTVFLTLLLRATQPAALSTTLLVALGLMQRPRDAAIILGAVVLMTAAGEPLRRWRLNNLPTNTSPSG